MSLAFRQCMVQPTEIVLLGWDQLSRLQREVDGADLI
jgi:hypothetical protein